MQQGQTQRGVFIRIPAEDYELLRRIASKRDRSVNYLAKRAVMHVIADQQALEALLS